MIGDLRDAVERADEFLGRVPTGAIERAAGALRGPGQAGLALALQETLEHLAAARRALARVQTDAGRPGRG